MGIAVIGLGRIGKVHAEIYRYRVEGAKLVAVVDIKEDLARMMGEKLGVKWYVDYEKALKDPEVDAVVICTPSYIHAEMAVRAAEEDKHIFCEKPLTVEAEDARKCVRAVEKAGVKLQVGYMRRFDYAYRRAKEKIEKGEIGEPLVFMGVSRDPAPPPGWVADPKLSGGLFLDLMSHDFDAARWLMGAEVEEVYVLAGALVYEQVRAMDDVDTAAVLMKFSGGKIGFVQGSRRSTFGYDIRAEVLGSEGCVFVGSSLDSTFALGTVRGVTFDGHPWFQRRFYDAYVEEDRHFVKVLLEDGEPLVKGVDGLRAVEIAEACWRSYREVRPVKLG